MAQEGPSGRLLILIVEDETLIRLVAEDMLREGGFATLSAASADGALIILQSRNDIRAVFSDIAMPGSLDGSELVIVVRDRWPPIGIVLTSGNGGLPPGLVDRVRFLPKPYRDVDLIEAIKSVLQGRLAAGEVLNRVELTAQPALPDPNMFGGTNSVTSIRNSLDWLATLRARLGVTSDNWLFYGALSFASKYGDFSDSSGGSTTIPAPPAGYQQNFNQWNIV